MSLTFQYTGRKCEIINRSTVTKIILSTLSSYRYYIEYLILINVPQGGVDEAPTKCLTFAPT